ncbi:hypothetical protein A9Q84_15090 [Halobacteriovorax marinus]|uniref:Transmembrane protein n=1 Tax=Halobacteriovorax marinus TaxID=97084 RepID=A0A1Y5FAP6_9BACT|nr:hypothetical protein A9Q84_15090 [Halobacteriovorax marinus]
MKKFLATVIVGAVVAQIWGMLSWMVLPWHNVDMKKFNNAEAVSQAIKSEQVGSGIYMIPNWDPKVHEDENLMKEWDRKAAAGPFVFMSVRAQGITPGMGPMMGIGFLLNIIIAAILFWLVNQTKIESCKKRAFFISIAGGVGGLYPIISNWNWWYFPAVYTVSGAADLFITWLLAGFAMVFMMNKLTEK